MSAQRDRNAHSTGSTSSTASELRPAPYTDHYVDIAGLRLRVHDYGTAGKPPMLCLHGGAANAHWYDFVAQGFTTDYHVRAIDLRGHGDSQWDTSPTPNYAYQRHAADVHELAEKLDLRDFILIGQSMGGDRKSTRLNSSHSDLSRMPSSA